MMMGLFIVFAVRPAHAGFHVEDFETTSLGEIPEHFVVLSGSASVQTVSQKNTFQGRGLRIDPHSVVELTLWQRSGLNLLFSSGNLANYEVRFDIRPGKEVNAEVLFRSTDDKNGYVFSVGRESMSLFRRDSGADTSFGTLSSENRKWRRYTIEASGESIRVFEVEGGGSGGFATGSGQAGRSEGGVSGGEVYVESTALLESEDTKYSTGRLLFVNPTDERFHIDNVEVREVGKGDSGGGCGGQLALRQ